jgi:hypothetical protein
MAAWCCRIRSGDALFDRRRKMGGFPVKPAFAVVFRGCGQQSLKAELPLMILFHAASFWAEAWADVPAR